MVTVEVGALLLLWCATVAKLALAATGKRVSSVRLLALSLVMIAGGITVNLDGVYLPLDQMLGACNVATLLVYGQAVVAVWALYRVLDLDLARHFGEGARRHCRADLPVALGALAVCYAVGPARLPNTPKADAHAYATPGTAAFFAVAAVASSFFIIRSVLAAHRLAGHAQRQHRLLLATGLLLMALAGVLGLVNNLFQLLIFPLLAGLAWARTVSDVLTGLGYLAGGLLGVGVILPAARRWRPLARLRQAVGERLAFAVLYPLWRDLAEIEPSIVLDRDGSRLGAVLAVRDVGYRLYRRVIEIRDGLLALQPFLAPSSVDEEAAGLGTDASSQAAIVAAAVLVKRRGAAAGATLGDHIVMPVGRVGLEQEIHWLSQVARSYRGHARRLQTSGQRAGRLKHKPVELR